MEKLLPIFIAIPLMGFIISFFIPEKKENWISRIIINIMGLYVIFTTLFISWWIYNHTPSLNIKEISLYQTKHYNFFIDLYFDKTSAVYLMFSGILSYLIAVYSRVYLHKEPGYKRFFITFSLFSIAIQIISLAGNFETLFIGWEFLGVSSFLLIAFYRHRYLPVRNAMKVFSVYRIADLGILLAMWLSHHFWHQNITFAQLNNTHFLTSHIQQNTSVAIIIGLFILLAASVKSAQLPFSSWIPRAMEGPTPSSAIFYGSIAVHIGVFLLLRTAVFWEHITFLKYTIAILGLLTAITATISSRVQYSAKAQIGYSSIAQIGLIFVEIAFGFHNIALIHLTSNAFLRTYQLIISPSMVAYYIREQFYNFVPYKKVKRTKLTKQFEATMYVIGLREWKLDPNLYKFLWYPIKKIGNRLNKINVPNSLHYLFALIPIVIYTVFVKYSFFNKNWHFPEIFSIIALLLIIRVFAARKQLILSWLMIGFSHLWILIAISFNEKFGLLDAVLYMAGVIITTSIGYFILNYLHRNYILDLNNFYGLAYKHKKQEFIFLLCALGLMGFPITTTFLGEDLLLSHIKESQILLVSTISITYVLTGISIIRIYARIFLGPVFHQNIAKANRTA